MAKSILNHVSEVQIDVLKSFMSDNPILPKMKRPRLDEAGKKIFDEMWNSLAEKLNAIGVVKTITEWQKVWIEYSAQEKAKEKLGNKQNKNVQPSEIQLEQLVIYMESHKLFALGQIMKLGVQGNIKYENMWKELTILLNSLDGPKKSPDQWKKIWTDLKQNSKRKKSAIIRHQKRSTGNKASGPPELNKLEEIVVSIIGKSGLGQELVAECGVQLTVPERNNWLKMAPNRQPSQAQMEKLVALVEDSPILARGRKTDDNACFFVNMSNTLNKIIPGTKKTPDEWIKTWRDKVGRTKKLMASPHAELTAINAKVAAIIKRYNLDSILQQDSVQEESDFDDEKSFGGHDFGPNPAVKKFKTELSASSASPSSNIDLTIDSDEGGGTGDFFDTHKGESSVPQSTRFRVERRTPSLSRADVVELNSTIRAQTTVLEIFITSVKDLTDAVNRVANVMEIREDKQI